MSTLKADTIVASDGSSPVTLTKQSAAKAWLQFDQTVPTTSGSFNISSVSDDSQGIFTPSLSNSMSSTNNQVITGMGNHKSADAEPRMMNLRHNQGGSFTTSAHTLATPNGGNASTNYDMNFNMSLVHGDLA